MKRHKCGCLGGSLRTWKGFEVWIWWKHIVQILMYWILFCRSDSYWNRVHMFIYIQVQKCTKERKTIQETGIIGKYQWEKNLPLLTKIFILEALITGQRNHPMRIRFYKGFSSYFLDISRYFLDQCYLL